MPKSKLCFGETCPLKRRCKKYDLSHIDSLEYQYLFKPPFQKKEEGEIVCDYFVERRVEDD